MIKINTTKLWCIVCLFLNPHINIDILNILESKKKKISQRKINKTFEKSVKYSISYINLYIICNNSCENTRNQKQKKKAKKKKSKENPSKTKQ